MTIKTRFILFFWILFIILGITLAINGFEQHLIYAILDKKYEWDYSFVGGVVFAGMGVSQLILFLKEK